MPFSSIPRPALTICALTAGAVVASPVVTEITQGVPAFTLAALAMALTAMLIDAGPGQRRTQLGTAGASGRRRRLAWVGP